MQNTPKTDIECLTLSIFSGTVQNIISEFITERRSRGLSTRTIEFYQDELKLFSGWTSDIGIINIEELTPDIIRRYLLALAERRNPGGVHAGFRSVRAMLMWYDDEYEPEGWKNPIRKVHPPAVKNIPLPGITISDVYKMVDICQGKAGLRDKSILLFLIDTGCRRGELLSLDISNIDFATGAVVIQHGKGDKSRTVYMGKNTKKTLRIYLKSRTDLSASSPLFANLDGSRIIANSLQSMVNRRAIKAGIPSPGIHDFRRCFAIEMLRNGCDLVTLSRLMGHASLEVTKRYLYQMDDDLKNAHALASPVDKSRVK